MFHPNDKINIKFISKSTLSEYGTPLFKYYVICYNVSFAMFISCILYIMHYSYVYTWSDRLFSCILVKLFIIITLGLAIFYVYHCIPSLSIYFITICFGIIVTSVCLIYKKISYYYYVEEFLKHVHISSNLLYLFNTGKRAQKGSSVSEGETSVSECTWSQRLTRGLKPGAKPLILKLYTYIVYVGLTICMYVHTF